MTLTPDDMGTGSVHDDLANRPTVVLPGPRGSRPEATPHVRPHARLRPLPPRAGKRAPLVVVAVANTLWSIAASLLPVLAIVAAVTLIADSKPGFTPTIRHALAGWLLAHGVPIALGGFPVALVPLAISAFAFWRVALAGRSTARASRAHVGLVAGTIAIGYGIAGVVAAGLANDRSVSVSVPRAALTLAAFGGIGSLIGASAGVGLVWHWWRRLPAIIQAGVRTGTVAAVLVLAAGALATGIATAVAGSTASQMLHGYNSGFIGKAGIVLLCLAYAPNVSVWASAYLTGTGFTLAGVPQVPIFAGLPSHPANGAAQLLLLMPVAAGVVAGILVARRMRRPQALWRLAVAGLCAGPAAAIGLWIAGDVAAGSLGSKLLAHTGDVGWQFSIVAGLGITVGALLGTLTFGWFRKT
jgi:Family of unknown function (DUF6350)